MGPIQLHRLGRNLHIVEHALQLLCELVAALHFELGEHPSLRIIGD